MVKKAIWESFQRIFLTSVTRNIIDNYPGIIKASTTSTSMEPRPTRDTAVQAAERAQI